MDFLGPDPNTSTEYVEHNKAFQDSHGASAFPQHELREQDLLRQLEEHSGKNSNCSVDCTLKLGLPSETTTLPLRNDENPPIGMENIYDIPQVMENYGMVNGGCSTCNRWGSLGSGHLNWLPYSYGEIRDGLGYYGSSLMGVPITCTFLDMEYARLSALALQQGSFPLSRLFAKKPEDGFTDRVRKCAECETTTTPLWRNGPKGTKSLCNACGIRYKKEERRALGIPHAYTRAKGSALKEPESSKKPQN